MRRILAIITALLTAATVLACAGETTITETTETATPAPTQVRATATAQAGSTRNDGQNAPETRTVRAVTGNPDHTPAPLPTKKMAAPGQEQDMATPEPASRMSASRYYQDPEPGEPRTIDNMSPEDRACLPDHVTDADQIGDLMAGGDTRELMECLSFSGKNEVRLMKRSFNGATGWDSRCYHNAMRSIGKTEAGNGGTYSIRQDDPMSDLIMLHIASWTYCTKYHDELPDNQLGDHQENMEIRNSLICLADQEGGLEQFIQRYGNSGGILNAVAEARRSEGACAVQ